MKSLFATLLFVWCITLFFAVRIIVVRAQDDNIGGVSDSNSHRRLQQEEGKHMSDALEYLQNQQVVVHEQQVGDSDNNQLRLQQQQSSSSSISTLNLLRRARDNVASTDIPFLLQTPYSSSETVYNIMTQCYGLVGKQFDTIQQIEIAHRSNTITNYYVNSHDRPTHKFQNFGNRFHFISTPYYQEGVNSLLTLGHKGRVVIIMRHPVDVAESEYYASLPNNVKHGDIKGLMQYVNSTSYTDNHMVRMLAGNIPPHIAVTEEHFRKARMVLENKFLIGITRDITEFVTKRLKLYFGYKELHEGCELDYIQKGISSSVPSTTLLEELGNEWRFIRKKNHFDMKLYGRGLAVAGMQKYRMPVHHLIREQHLDYAKDAMGHLKNVKDVMDRTDLPFFWHIPKASGTTVKEILSNCYNLVRNEMVKPPSDLRVNKKRNILNIDLSTPENVEAAKALNVADVGIADVFVSQLALEGSTVFTNQHKGRAFTIMRHPVKLAASLFYYRRIATWEPTYRPEYKDITLYDYVAMNGYYDNWMVRMLTNSKIGGLNQGHLDLAKSILKDKFVIGISDHMDETFRVLELSFGWTEQKEGCVNFHLHSAPSNKNKYPDTERGSPTWALIAEKNMYDMALYYYALELFGDQSEKMFRTSG